MRVTRKIAASAIEAWSSQARVSEGVKLGQLLAISTPS